MRGLQLQQHYLLAVVNNFCACLFSVGMGIVVGNDRNCSTAPAIHAQGLAKNKLGELRGQNKFHLLTSSKFAFLKQLHFLAHPCAIGNQRKY